MTYKQYTPEQEATIRQFAGTKSAKEIGLMIGKDELSVRNKAYKKNISLGVARKPYTKEEEEVIREYAGVKTAEEIGVMIGRTRTMVLSKARMMRVSLKMAGEDHHNSVLSNLQVEMVNALTVNGFKPHEIHQAAFSHVHYNTVQSITSCWNRKEK